MPIKLWTAIAMTAAGALGVLLALPEKPTPAQPQNPQGALYPRERGHAVAHPPGQTPATARQAGPSASVPAPVRHPPSGERGPGEAAIPDVRTRTVARQDGSGAPAVGVHGDPAHAPAHGGGPAAERSPANQADSPPHPRAGDDRQGAGFSSGAHAGPERAVSSAGIVVPELQRRYPNEGRQMRPYAMQDYYQSSGQPQSGAVLDAGTYQSGRDKLGQALNRLNASDRQQP